MGYKVTTLMPSLGSNTAGCSTFCDTQKEVLKEVKSSLVNLLPGESIIVECDVQNGED